ncbi:MAG: hypothetical protein CMM23_08265 [Rhodospirillaceae bacterium]|nr:hypothetical protein [Rhodospirillaceae bacterium]
MERPASFFVIATLNPVEMEGTFPLPEAQLDRFLLRLDLGYPSLEEEAAMLNRFVSGGDGPASPALPRPTWGRRISRKPRRRSTKLWWRLQSAITCWRSSRRHEATKGCALAPACRRPWPCDGLVRLMP